MSGSHPRVSALSLSGDAEGLAAARRWIDDFLVAAHVARPCIDDAVLIVSELTSNAVRHGAGDVVCEAVILDPSRCFVSVVDFGGGHPGIVRRDDIGVGGLGLVIVERLALDWGVAPFARGKAVFAVIGIDVGHGGDPHALA